MSEGLSILHLEVYFRGENDEADERRIIKAHSSKNKGETTCQSITIRIKKYSH